jgi:hypothetical protein
MACFAFYVLVVQNVQRTSALYRSFAGDNAQIKVAIAGLFFIAVASLAIKLFRVGLQFGAVAGISLPDAPCDGQAVEEVHDLEKHLEQAPPALVNAYLGHRLFSALAFVKQRRSADGLETHLHRLDEADRRRAADGHAAVRAIAATMVILGALGTVTGLPTALAAAPPEAAATSIIKGLSVALEPTLQALALFMILIFARLLVEGAEGRLLSAVTDSAQRQLVGRFRQLGTETDPHLASIRRMSEQALETIEGVVARHEAALSRSIGAAGRRWEEMASAATAAIHRSVGEALAAGLKDHAQALNGGVAKHAADLEGTLIRHAEILSENIDAHTAALAEALEHHTAVMTETEKSLAAENRTHLADMEAALGEAMLVAATRQEKLIQQSENLLKEMRAALAEAAAGTVGQHEQLIKQSDVLLKVVEATGQIRKLEDALNRNLSSLAGAHNFEQTAASLAAAVQLLAARIEQPIRLRDEIDLRDDETTSQVATDDSLGRAA